MEDGPPLLCGVAFEVAVVDAGLGSFSEIEGASSCCGAVGEAEVSECGVAGVAEEAGLVVAADFGEIAGVICADDYTTNEIRKSRLHKVPRNQVPLYAIGKSRLHKVPRNQVPQTR